MLQLLSLHFKFLEEFAGDTHYKEYTDKQGNTFIYEDGELTSIILPNGYHIHIYSDGEPEIQEQD